MKRWLVVFAAVALAVLVVAVALAQDRGRSARAELHGVRLGMTVSDVRSRFDVAGAGQWESTAKDAMILKWRPSDAARGGPVDAQFEFHMGLVMAIRADLPPGDPAARGPEFELSDATVIEREKAPSGLVHYTAIARSCPIHAREADKLVAAHAR